jgi:hypothetical protein
MKDNPPFPLSVRPKPSLKRSGSMKRARLSPQMASVLDVMALEGLSVRDAARQVGMSPDAALKALKRPHVKTAYNHMLNEVRQNAAHRAYLRICHLAEAGDSEEVRLRACMWVAGVEDIAPLKKVQAQFASGPFGGFLIGGENE